MAGMKLQQTKKLEPLTEKLTEKSSGSASVQYIKGNSGAV